MQVKIFVKPTSLNTLNVKLLYYPHFFDRTEGTADPYRNNVMVPEEAVQYFPVIEIVIIQIDWHWWRLRHLPCLTIHSEMRWIVVIRNVDYLLPAEVPPHLAIIHLPIVPHVEGEGGAVKSDNSHDQMQIDICKY